MIRVSRISRRSIFWSVGAIAASNVLLQALGFLYRIFLSRMTGAEGVGVYSLIMPFYSVLTSVTLTGITIAVSRISAERAAVGDFAGARHCVSVSRLIFVALVALVSAVTLRFPGPISETLLGDARCRMALPFILVCLLFTGFENILKNYFYGVARVAPQIVTELSEQIIRIAAVAALLLVFRPADAGEAAALIILGMVISELASSSILTLFYLPEKRRGSRGKRRPMLRQIASIAFPVSAAATLNNVLSSANAVLIPRRLVTSGMTAAAATESFGIMFGMTMPLLAFPIAFIAALTSIMVPRLSEGLSRGDDADVRRKAGKAIHTTSLLAMPCMAILIPLGGSACRLIFAQSSAGAYMLPLCIATLLSYYQITTGALLNGIGMQRRAAVYIIIGGLLQLAFTWSVGIPQIGMKGFVYGYLFSSGLIALLNLICLMRRLKLRLRFRNWFFTPLLSSVFSALITDIFFKSMLSRGIAEWLALLAATAVGAAVYCAALSALGTSITRYIKTLIPKSAR